MAYSTSAPPALISQGIGGGLQTWRYETADASTVVDGANYFTNGGSLGMALGAQLITVETDNTYTSYIQTVNAVGNGTTDLTNGVAITNTDSD